MKVIFKKDVGGVGQRGSVKDVSDGYALNFLIPNGLAEQATPDKVEAYKKQQEALKRDQAARDTEWAGHADRINGGRVQMLVRANDRGHLYKQLSARDIAAEISNTYHIDVPATALVIESPIKSVGEQHIAIKFGAHTAKLTLAVVS